MEKTYALLFNVALYKKISFLEPGAAEALITEPVRDLYQLEPAAVERILEVTSNHPYYTQLICHGLFNRWQQNQASPLTVADVEASLDEAVERGLAVLKHVWEESNAAERAVLAGMSAVSEDYGKNVSIEEIHKVWSKLDVFIPSGDIAKAIRSLIARDVITGHEKYRFTVDLQRRWLRQYERLEWVKEEIPEEIDSWREVAPSPPSTDQRLFGLLTSWKTWALILPAVFILFLLFIIINQQTGGSSVPESETGADAVSLGMDVAQTQVNDLIAAGDFIWTATDGGLIRWNLDGNGHLVPNEELGFPGSCINTIAEDADGNLWIGCGGAAVTVWDGDQLADHIYFDRDQGLPMGLIQVLAAGQGGEVIFAGGPLPEEDEDNPLALFEVAWESFPLPFGELAAREMEPSIWSILHDQEDRLWMGLERDGIIMADNDGWHFYRRDRGVGREGSGDFRVRRLIQDKQGNIWAAAGAQGLLYYEPRTDSWERNFVLAESEIISDIAEFDNGEFWVAGRISDDQGNEQGFIGRRPASMSPPEDGGWEFVGPQQELGSDIHGLVQDPDGKFWVGTYDRGVFVFDSANWQHLQQ